MEAGKIRSEPWSTLSTENCQEPSWAPPSQAWPAFLSKWPKWPITEIRPSQRSSKEVFKKNLIKGYKSYFNALRRIPFEEGPYYLFKNAFPIIFRNFLSTFTLFYTYDWLKDKLSWMWRANEVPYQPVAYVCGAFATYLAAVFTYPFYHVSREMVFD